MSGELRAKREVAYLLVPAIGRKVIDLGSNVEKGSLSVTHSFHVKLTPNRTHNEADRQFINYGNYGTHCREYDTCFEDGSRH